jgi:tetratricopeptide (TPR) repeat protein
MFANSALRLRHICGAITTAAFIVLSATDALAVDPQDLKDCQDSADIPRMIAAYTTLAQDTALNPGARSMALLKRGFGNFALDHIDAAQADFSEAIKLNPKNNYAHHELGLILVKKGDLTHPIASLTEAINIDPTSAASRFSRGQVYMSEDELDEAIRDFTDAIALGADKNTAFTRDQAVRSPEGQSRHDGILRCSGGRVLSERKFQGSCLGLRPSGRIFRPGWLQSDLDVGRPHSRRGC